VADARARGLHAPLADRHARRALAACIFEEHLVGAIELPIAVSTVGPVVHSNPHVRLALRMLGVSSARELPRSWRRSGSPRTWRRGGRSSPRASSAGTWRCTRAPSPTPRARGEQAEEVRRRLLAAGEVKIDRARELLRALGARS